MDKPPTHFTANVLHLFIRDDNDGLAVAKCQLACLPKSYKSHTH